MHSFLAQKKFWWLRILKCKFPNIFNSEVQIVLTLHRFIVNIIAINQKYQKHKRKLQIFCQYFPSADFLNGNKQATSVFNTAMRNLFYVKSTHLQK